MASINSGTLSGSLASMFQTAYTNSLLNGNTLGTSSSLASLALRTNVPGSNPLNPLQGVSAVTGLGQFVTQVQTQAALRKAGLLPPVGAAAAAQSSQALTGLLGALSSLGGVGAADPLSALLGGSLGGADPLAALLGADATAAPTASIAPATSAALASDPLAGIAAADASNGLESAGNAGNALGAAAPAAAAGGDAQLAAQLQGLLSMLQSLIGGQGAATPGATSLIGGQPIAGQNILFPQTVNFNVIDTAINQALGGIFNTLPLVKI